MDRYSRYSRNGIDGVVVQNVRAWILKRIELEGGTSSHRVAESM